MENRRDSENKSEGVRKNVLITGCSSGLGLQMALRFSKTFNVIATVRDKKKIDDLKKEKNKNIHIEQLDLTDLFNIPEIVNSILMKYGPISVLIHNAGAGHLSPLRETNIEDINKIFNITILGPHLVTSTILSSRSKDTLQSNNLRIIAISTMNTLIATPFSGMYNSAKSALNTYMQTLDTEEKSSGVVVSVVLSGPMKTMLLPTVIQNSKTPSDPKQAIERQSYLNLLGKIPPDAIKDPQETADLVLSIATAPAEKVDFYYTTCPLSKSAAETILKEPRKNLTIPFMEGLSATLEQKTQQTKDRSSQEIDKSSLDIETLEPPSIQPSGIHTASIPSQGINAKDRSSFWEKKDTSKPQTFSAESAVIIEKYKPS